MVKLSVPDVPPPGEGLNTDTAAVPTTARSAAPIAAWSCVELTGVVGRSAPFQRTIEDVTKLLPLTVSVKAAPPTKAIAGEIVVTTGTGLSVGSTVTAG